MGSLFRGRGPKRVPEGSRPSRGRRGRRRFAGEKRDQRGTPRRAHSDPRRKPYSEPAEKKGPASGRRAEKSASNARDPRRGGSRRDSRREQMRRRRMEMMERRRRGGMRRGSDRDPRRGGMRIGSDRDARSGGMRRGRRFGGMRRRR